VLEEQGPRPDETALKSFDLAASTAVHPTLIAGITDYFQGGRTPDDPLDDCLDVVIAGAAAAT